MLLQMIQHHSGRISMYVLMGLCLGFAGESMAGGSLQMKLSLAAGLFLLLTLILPKFTFSRKFTRFLTRKWQQVSASSKWSGNFGLGIINGLLPCGLVYTALAAATATATPLHGALFMLLFGLGTTPLLLSSIYLGRKFSGKRSAGWVIPLATSVTALLLILRGLNLGIPYISPTLEADNKPACCEVKAE